MAVIAAFLVAWTAVGMPFTNGQAAPERITAASNVRVRAEPSEEVSILATVPLGTSVSELEQTADGQWLRVRLPDGAEGWMAAGLTRRVPAGERHRVVRRLIGERLAREGDAFRARVELVDLVERSAEGVTDAEDAAELAYLRLRAIGGVLRSLFQTRLPRPDAQTAWLDARRDLVTRNEPGGWRLRHEAILAEHDRHQSTRWAQPIAWMAVTNGLGGECEGDVACYVRRANLLEGAYLRQYPAGSYVGTALTNLIRRAGFLVSLSKDSRSFNPSTDCESLEDPLASLRASVADVADRPMPGGSGEGPLRIALLDLLDQVGAACATAR